SIVGAFARLGAVATLVAALAGLAGAVPVHADDAYRVMVSRVDSSRFPDVKFNATVLDSQFVPVSDLAIGDWELLEDGSSVNVTSAAAVTSAESPISVIVGLDSGLTMEGRPLKDIKDAASDFIVSLQPEDLVSVLTFGQPVKVVERFTKDKASVAARVR